MIEAELRAEFYKLKSHLLALDKKVQHLDPKADAILEHLVKSKYTLCWIVGLVFFNAVACILIGLKL